MSLVTSLVALSAPPVLHLGQLHAYERVLVLLVAFGPFVALGFVVHVVRRRDLAAEAAEAAAADAAPERGPETS